MSTRGKVRKPGSSPSFRSSPYRRPQDTGTSNRGNGQGTSLSPADSRNIGRADVAVDLVLRDSCSNEVEIQPDNTRDEDNDSRDENLGTQRDSNVPETPSFSRSLPYAVPLGSKFADSQVHHRIRAIFNQFLNKAWASFKMAPQGDLDEMFDVFGTHYQWDPADKNIVKTNFENWLKGRFSDIMNTYRKVSKKLAINADHFIPPNVNNFAIMRDFPPNLLNDELWRDLCDAWDTPAFEKQSQSGRANRMSGDSSGSVCRHTSGSMSYDERRVKLTKKRPPTFVEVYFDTHLTKEAKKRFWAKDYEDIHTLEFSSPIAKENFEAYMKERRQEHGEDETRHPVDDLDMWKRVQEGRSKSRRVYGVGSSDANFVITGTSSSQGSNPVNAKYEQSQQRVRLLEEQCSQMAEQCARMTEKMSQTDLQIAEILKKIGNNPPINP